LGKFLSSQKKKGNNVRAGISLSHKLQKSDDLHLWSKKERKRPKKKEDLTQVSTRSWAFREKKGNGGHKLKGDRLRRSKRGRLKLRGKDFR